jgi:hypothetical protein
VGQGYDDAEHSQKEAEGDVVTVVGGVVGGRRQRE